MAQAVAIKTYGVRLVEIFTCKACCRFHTFSGEGFLIAATRAISSVEGMLTKERLNLHRNLLQNAFALLTPTLPYPFPILDTGTIFLTVQSLLLTMPRLWYSRAINVVA